MPSGSDEVLNRLRSAMVETSANGPQATGLVLPGTGAPLDSERMVPLVGLHLKASPERSLLVVDDREPAHLQYVGTYLTLSEYWPSELMPGRLDNSMLQAFADEARRTSLIETLAAVNEVSKRPDGNDLLEDLYLAAMPDQLRTRLRAALKLDRGGLGTQIVGPQPILLALRWLLGRPSASEPIVEPGNDETTRRAIAFSHMIATTIREDSDELEDTEKSAIELALVLGGLGVNGSGRDIYSSIDRAVRLWRDYGSLAESRLGRSAHRQFAVSCGVEPEDVLAVGFALMSWVSAWVPGKPYVVDRRLHERAPQEMCQAVLDLIGEDLAAAQRQLGDPQSEFDWLAIEGAPVLVEARGLVVLDKDLLWTRCTTGLYWFLHDALKASEGDKVCQEWRIAYGEMVEALAEDSLQPLAPRILGSSGQTFFTEDDFSAAYPSGGKVCDVGIDFGEDFLLAEIVSGQLTVQARVGGDLEKLALDFDKLVISKCEQLDSVALKLLDDEQPLTGATRLVPMRIVPVVVVGGGLPVNIATYRYIRQCLRESDLLTHPRIDPLAVVDLEDVETLEGMHEGSGQTPTRILRDWQTSDHADLPLRNYLDRYVPDPPFRPTRMDETVKASLDDILTRLRIRPDDHVARAVE